MDGRGALEQLLQLWQRSMAVSVGVRSDARGAGNGNVASSAKSNPTLEA